MQVSGSTYFVFVIVVTIMILSVTVFKAEKGSVTGPQNVGVTNPRQWHDRKDRYPVVEYDEPEPIDPVKRAKLKKQKQRYEKDSPFTHPGPTDEELSFRPEAQFDFPAFPIVQSDVILIGQVLEGRAHRSENKMNVFSNFDVRVVELLKGSYLTEGSVITVQRIGGFVKYPDGRKVLFRLSGNGMPAVGARYIFFLNVVDEDYSILTGYELGTEGVVPLDNSRQFQVYQGQNEADFLKALRDAVSRSVP
jgi:hypothetical protein